MVDMISIDLVEAAKQSFDVSDEYTHDDLINAVNQYKKFLALAVTHRETSLVPTKQIDMIWHLHMLHPLAYYNDCMALFGHILDHKGTSSSRADEQAAHFASLNATSVLWKREYGEAYVAEPSSSMAKAGSCRADGKCQVQRYAMNPVHDITPTIAGVENIAR